MALKISGNPSGRPRGYKRPTSKEELKSREWLNFALKHIGGGK